MGVIIFSASCTDLEEKVLSESLGSESSSDPYVYVAPAYAFLRTFDSHEGIWGLNESTSDEAAFPTRGTDWYDNGKWQNLYRLNYKVTNDNIRICWDYLSTGLARANLGMMNLDKFKETDEIKHYKAELKFLRCFYMYQFMDIYGIVPFREYTEIDFSSNPKILKRAEAFDIIIQELLQAESVLKSKSELQWGQVSKAAAQTLLAKLYLNKEVYTGTADWASCITYCDKVIADDYSIVDGDKYFSLFRAANHLNNPEAILVAIKDANEDANFGWVATYHYTLHYAQASAINTALDINVSGWNGVCTTPDFYNKFDAADQRRNSDELLNTGGFKLGFLVGQQYDHNGDEIKDGGVLVNYTPDFSLETSTRTNGIRVLKYAPESETNGCDNDFLIFRISDLYLMRAEAKFRKDGGTAGLDDINAVRAKRNVPALASISLDKIFDERGFELYWEGMRRQDQIRFGKFLTPKYEKTGTSNATKIVFPLPQTASDALGYQNEGY